MSCCHWCHIMENESFEDQEVADYLNRYFIAVKVDREERPDVDSIYMSACLKLTGSGGWPLTVFMLPDQKPFFAGTYFPKRSRYRMPGLLDLLETVHEKWESDREELNRSGESIAGAIRSEEPPREQGKLTKELIKKAAGSLINHFDAEYGGFGTEPKFPAAHNLMFLLRTAYYEDNRKALEIVEKTLDSMYQGGIFDHIGYGFCRYSTDREWLVPHFEKMLYDNALLVTAYLEAFQLTGRPRYRHIAEMTMSYVLRELTDAEGGFYCAQDADSEGVEGKYYVFRPEEAIELLGEEDGSFFNEYYGITKKGNFEGRSIPNRMHIEINGLKALENQRILPFKEKMYEYRLSRTKLHKDDKVLTSWNGIMITAFANAYRILGDESYLKAAEHADRFIRRRLCKGERLLVHYRDGKAVGTGHLDDYAFYIQALLALYEATFQPDYLARALQYSRVMLEQFFDAEKGGFYLYASDAEALIHRPKELYDGAIPSGNSVAAYVLQRLAAYTGRKELLEAAEKQMGFIAGGISNYPEGHCFSVIAAMQVLYPAKELIGIFKDSSNMERLRQILAGHFLPDLTVLVKLKENAKQLEQIAPFTKDYESEDHPAAFYLCENHSCMAPVYEPEALETLLIKTGL